MLLSDLGGSDSPSICDLSPGQTALVTMATLLTATIQGLGASP